MRPNLSFYPGKVPRKAKCEYIQSELLLVYEARSQTKNDDKLSNLSDAINHQLGIDKTTELLLIADTLTLTFSDDDKHLSLLDAYTNRSYWATSQVRTLPKVIDHGLLLADIELFEGDRYSLNFTPRYEIASTQDWEIASTQNWVRIVLIDVEETTYYEVAEDLVIGLKEQMITDIFLIGARLL